MHQRSHLAKKTCGCLVISLRANSSSSSDHGGQLVYEVIDGVDHQLDVVLLRHAVLAISPEDDVDVRAQDALGDLHGDVPGDVLVFEAVDEPHGAGDGDGALKNTVILCLVQKVHANLVETFLRVFGRQCPLPFGFDLLARLWILNKQTKKTNSEFKKLKQN